MQKNGSKIYQGVAKLVVEKPVVAELVLSYPGRNLENVPHSKNTSTHSNVFTVKVDTPGAAQQNCLHAQQKKLQIDALDEASSKIKLYHS